VYRSIKFAAVHDVAREIEEEAVEAAIRQRAGRRRRRSRATGSAQPEASESESANGASSSRCFALHISSELQVAAKHVGSKLAAASTTTVLVSQGTLPLLVDSEMVFRLGVARAVHYLRLGLPFSLNLKVLVSLPVAPAPGAWGAGPRTPSQSCFVAGPVLRHGST
jgi:hypothetical protein